MKKYKLKKDFPSSKIGDVWVKADNGFMSPEGSPIKMHEQLFEPFNEWFEEEPKGKALYWMILTLENFIENEPNDEWMDLEDCKQTLKKLKALQRLKDKRFRFKRYKYSDILEGTIGIEAQFDNDGQANKDLDLLFGGEE